MKLKIFLSCLSFIHMNHGRKVQKSMHLISPTYFVAGESNYPLADTR